VTTSAVSLRRATTRCSAGINAERGAPSSVVLATCSPVEVEQPHSGGLESFEELLSHS
jgi:hypothetical protein